MSLYKGKCLCYFNTVVSGNFKADRHIFSEKLLLQVMLVFIIMKGENCGICLQYFLSESG